MDPQNPFLRWVKRGNPDTKKLDWIWVLGLYRSLEWETLVPPHYQSLNGVAVEHAHIYQHSNCKNQDFKPRLGNPTPKHIQLDGVIIKPHPFHGPVCGTIPPKFRLLASTFPCLLPLHSICMTVMETAESCSCLPKLNLYLFNSLHTISSKLSKPYWIRSHFIRKF